MLDMQARAMDSGVKEFLAEMKKNRQSEYKDRVRSARLIPGQSGRNAALARREVLQSFLTNVSVSRSVREITGVDWLSRDEFVGRRITQFGQSRAEAEAFWAVEVRNPQRAKRGAGDAVRLAVQMPPPDRGQFRDEH